MNWNDMSIDGMSACRIRNSLYNVAQELETDGESELANVCETIGNIIADAQGNHAASFDELPNDIEIRIAEAAEACK